MAVEVPFGVEGVSDGAGGVALGPHGQLAVRVALTWAQRDDDKCCSTRLSSWGLDQLLRVSV